MFSTVKRKIFLVLFLFVLGTVLTSVTAFNYFVRQRDSLSNINKKTEDMHTLLLQDMHLMHQFFESETINPDFFESGKSDIIIKHNQVCDQIIKVCGELNLAQQKNHFKIEDSIINLKHNILVYTGLVDNIIRQILRRGFKDYGVEGKMRNYAHQLEANSETIGLVNILQLRRHEKDFIIRQEESYVNKHAALVADIENTIEGDKKTDSAKKEKVLQLLVSYNVEFIKLVAIEKRLGLRSYGGQKKAIDRKCVTIEASLSVLQQIFSKKVEAAILDMEIIYLFIGVLFILISLMPAVFISKKVARAVSGAANNSEPRKNNSNAAEQTFFERSDLKTQDV